MWRHGCEWRPRLSMFGLLSMVTACSWKSVIEAPAAPTIAPARPSPGRIEIDDRDGSSVEIDPSTSLRFVLRDGQFTAAYDAGSLCHDATGVYLASPDCQHVRRIAKWSEVGRVEIEGFDAVASTFAGIGSIVASPIVVPVLIQRSTGTRPPTISLGPVGLYIVEVPPYVSPLPYTESEHDDDTEPHTVPPSRARPSKPPTPFFTSNALRRHSVSFTVAFDGGTCLYDPASCSTGALRAGVRFVEYVELTGSIRTIRGWGHLSNRVRWAGMGGIGVHASFPRLRQLAFYLGFDVGPGDSIPFIFDVRAGLRFSILPELTIGLFPFSPTFILGRVPGDPSGWQAPTSLEVSTAF